MSSHALSRLPHVALLLPVLLVLFAGVSGQLDYVGDVFGALVANKIESCIDKLNALAQLFGGGTAAYTDTDADT